MKKITFLMSLIIAISAKSQVIKEWGVGPEIMYNIPIKGLGIGVRSHLHLSERLFVSPQISFYPGWNQIVESYWGANINYNLSQSTKWGVFLNAGPYYNHWSNYESSDYSKAQQANFTAEFGGGLVKNFGCVRPFLEYRVNSKWWESNLRLGFNVYFGGCKGRKGRNSHLCPAYTSL